MSPETDAGFAFVAGGVAWLARAATDETNTARIFIIDRITTSVVLFGLDRPD